MADKDRDHGEDRMEIPQSARDVKAEFFRREEADGVVKEITEWIKSGGEPFMWRGHTHTKPPPGSRPVYIDDFRLPENRIKAARWTPCPCCSPEHPKFGTGKISWFPDEGVIRLMGPTCFKSMDAEGHEEAEKQFHIEKKQRETVAYLLSKLPLVPGVISAGENALSVARGIEEFHRDLQLKLTLDRYDLWRHVRQGEVIVVELSEQLRINADGSMRTEEVELPRVYARIQGYGIVDPSMPKLSGQIEAALSRLREYVFEDCAATVDTMDGAEKNKASSRVGKSVQVIRDSVKELRILQKFVEKVNINTLRNWGQSEGCPAPRVFEHRGTRIAFGRSEYECCTVPIPPEMTLSLRDVAF